VEVHISRSCCKFLLITLVNKALFGIVQVRMLTIKGMIGKAGSNRDSFIQADLGDTKDGNILSIGAALDERHKIDDLVTGVHFDITIDGRLCYIKKDFKSLRCVGNVKGVTVLKGTG